MHRSKFLSKVEREIDSLKKIKQNIATVKEKKPFIVVHLGNVGDEDKISSAAKTRKYSEL